MAVPAIPLLPVGSHHLKYSSNYWMANTPLPLYMDSACKLSWLYAVTFIRQTPYLQPTLSARLFTIAA